MSKFYENLDNKCEKFMEQIPVEFVEDEGKITNWVKQANIEGLIQFAYALDMYDELDTMAYQNGLKLLTQEFFNRLSADMRKYVENLIKFQNFHFEAKNVFDFSTLNAEEHAMLKSAVILNFLTCTADWTPEYVDLIPYLYTSNVISPYVGVVYKGTRKYNEESWNDFLQRAADGWHLFLCAVFSGREFDAMNQIVETAETASICDVDANLWEHRDMIKLY